MDPDTAKEIVQDFRATNWRAEKIEIDTEEDYLLSSAVKIYPTVKLDESTPIKLPHSVKQMIGEIAAELKDDISMLTEREDGDLRVAFILDDGEIVDVRPLAEQERAERLIEAIENQYPKITIGPKYREPKHHRLAPHYTHLGDIITATEDELMKINRIGEKRAERIVNKHSQKVKQSVESGIEERKFLIEDTDGTYRFAEEYVENEDLEPNVPVLKPEDINPETQPHTD